MTYTRPVRPKTNKRGVRYAQTAEPRKPLKPSKRRTESSKVREAPAISANLPLSDRPDARPVPQPNRSSRAIRLLPPPHLICNQISGQSASFLFQTVAYGYALEQKTASLSLEFGFDYRAGGGRSLLFWQDDAKRRAKRPNRQRKTGAGKKLELSVPEILFMQLLYYRTYITHVFVGFLMDIRLLLNPLPTYDQFSGQSASFLFQTVAMATL